MQKMGKNCDKCTEWQDHCYWSHMADENKHFFKLMTGDFTQSMSLPGRFARNFNGHISESEDINLKPPGGKSWSIKVAGGADEVVLRSGWKEFLDGHAVREGDRLLFKYSGASSFDVLMFDSTGCQKPPPLKRRGRDDDIAENSAGVKGRQCGHHAPSKTEERAPHPPPASSDGAGLEMTLYGDTGKSISLACSEHDLCHGREQDRLGGTEQQDVEMDHGEASVKAGYYFCKNGPVSEFHLTEEDKEQISSIRVPVEPGNPVFVQVIHSSHVRDTTRTSIVGVSSEFAGKYMADIGREIILRRGGGRKGRWHVRYLNGGYYRGLCGRGWRDFARNNRLLAHDVCIFELVEGTRPPSANVHVLRRMHGRFVLVR